MPANPDRVTARRAASAAIGVILSAGLACGSAGGATPRWDGLQQTIDAVVAAKTVPGAIVLVRQGGREVFAAAAGQADGQTLKTDTVFWIASMTKPMVAATVLMLVDEGKVRLDDPVSKYIPEFAKPRLVRRLRAGSSLPPPGPPVAGAAKPDYDLEPAQRALTVRDFITMTAGLQTIGVPNDGVPPVTDDDTVASYTAKLGDAPLDFQPGSRWAYSNATEFEILVRVVEVASGEPYAEFVQRRLFDPLGMKDSHFGVREDLKDRVAPLGGMATSPLRTGRFTSGSAGVWTTAEDYSHFAQMLLDGGEYAGRRLLAARTVRAMTANQIGGLTLGGVNPADYGGLTNRVNTGIKYGFGLAVVTDPKVAGLALPVGSFGWDGVGSRRFWVDPTDKTVLVMLLPSGDAAAAQRRIEAAAMEAVHRK